MLTAYRAMFARLCILFAGIVMSGAASASFLGETIGVQTQFPTQGAVCCGSGSAVVSGAVEFPAGSFPSYNTQAFVDIFDMQIEYGQTAGTGYSDGAFNGFRFFDVLDLIDDIIAVSINGETNIAGFDAGRVSFDANNVFINLQGLSAAAAHHVVLDVAFQTASVPEPATLALFGIGLAGLGFSRRKRTN